MNKLLLIAAIVGLSACTQIDTGNIGVERAFGKIGTVPQPQGVYMTVLDSVDEYTTKEVSFTMNDLSPKSQDNLTLKDLDVDVYFRTNPAFIPKLVIKYQGDEVRHGEIVQGGSDVRVVGYNRVMRAAREAAYQAIARFPATTMHTKRPEISEVIRQKLQAELDASDKDAFVVTTINIRNLLTDEAIEQSIRLQVKMDQDIVRKEKEIVLAGKEADRLRAQAQGEADANGILAASLTPNVMQLRMAEIQRQTIVQSAKAGNTVISGVDPVMTIGVK